MKATTARSLAAEIRSLPPALLEGKRLAYSVEEAAEALSVSPSTIYNLASARALPHRKIGGRLVFTREDLIEYLDTVKVGAIRG